MEENLFVNVDSPVKHAASLFSVRKNVTIIQKRQIIPGWTDISGPGPAIFFIQMIYVLHYANST